MLEPSPLERLLAELAAGPAETPVELLRALCHGAPATVGVSGAAVTVTAEGGSAVVAASDAGAQRLGDLQLLLLEGPGIDAHDGHAAVLVADLRRSVRWNAYGAAAGRLGAAAVFGFPLQLGAITVGSLTMHRDEPGELTAASLNLAFGIAEVATRLLLTGQDATDHGDRSLLWADLDGDWTVVHQATGMTSAQLGVRMAEALVRLRARAFADDRTLADVAHDVVDRRLRLDSDPRIEPH